MDERDVVVIECKSIERNQVTLIITDWAGVKNEISLAPRDTATMRGFVEIIGDAVMEA